MKALLFSYKDTCGISQEDLRSVALQLEPEIVRLDQARQDHYQSVYASINVPFDSELHEMVNLLVEKKRALQPTALVVIGIGGSNLGTVATYEALFGRFYNAQQPDIKIFWADTTDTDYILDIVLLLEQELESGKEVLLNVVTKSGTTTETIANFELFLDLLKRHRPQTYKDSVIVTTDKDSPLWKLAEKEKFDRIAIPKLVGGRYSVLSGVGLFPLAMLGIDIKKLAAGARDMVEQCCNKNFFDNPAALAAALLYLHYKKNVSIHDIFLFSNDLKSLGQWYRQLLAESIGKERDIDGKAVNVGIMPTVSIGSTDLHSMVEYHLGGPNDTFTTFVSVEKNKSNILVPCLENYEQLVPHIQCKPLSVIMNAILQGVKRAYQEKKRAFTTLIIPEKTERYIGQFLQMHMVSIIYLGYLLHINPFDQPEVELYKNQTRKILAHE